MKANEQGIYRVLIVSLSRTALFVLAVVLVLGSKPGLRAQTGEWQLVPPEDVPQNATFLSMQLPWMPSLPFDPYGGSLHVYCLTNVPGLFWVDDRSVDYATPRAEQQAARSMARASVLDSADDLPPLPGGWGGGDGGGDEESNSITNGPPMYMTGQGLCLFPPVVQGSNVVLVLTNGDDAATYDLYATTNLSPNVPGLNLTNWLWLGRLTNGQTVVTVPLLSDLQCWYRLGTTWDTDGDGLPDAYENLVSHTSPNVFNLVSSDGYGTPDAWYLQRGLNPLGQGIASQDSDQDGLPNWREYLWGSNPQAAEGFSVWVSSPAGNCGIP